MRLLRRSVAPMSMLPSPNSLGLRMACSHSSSERPSNRAAFARRVSRRFVSEIASWSHAATHARSRSPGSQRRSRMACRSVRAVYSFARGSRTCASRACSNAWNRHWSSPGTSCKARPCRAARAARAGYPEAPLRWKAAAVLAAGPARTLPRACFPCVAFRSGDKHHHPRLGRKQGPDRKWLVNM